jgi:hypothetical protein
LKTHLQELRQADQRALDIKEAEAAKALQLAREHQIYRDEQANNLREQINRERGSYATRSDLEAVVTQITTELEPVKAYMQAQQGRAAGITTQTALFLTLGGLAIAMLTLVLAFAR